MVSSVRISLSDSLCNVRNNQGGVREEVEDIGSVNDAKSLVDKSS